MLVRVVAALAALAIGVARCGYLITFPRKWAQESQAQICATLTEGTFLESDLLTYSLTEEQQRTVLAQDEQIKFPTGKSSSCIDVPVPATEDGRVKMELSGTVGGEDVSEDLTLSFSWPKRRTFIQTDKALYRQGQTVEFRVLSIHGPNSDIDTKNYDEVYVSNPSKTRIAQWLNVDNSAGLVHLSFDLHDEAEQGKYQISVKYSSGRVESKSFSVEDYVLPKFEVKIAAVNDILGSDETVDIEMCARYTFGQPVTGNGTLYLAAGNWRTYANLSDSQQMNGCMKATFSAKDLLFDHNNCHIRISNLRARGVVVEEGTNVEIYGANDNIPVNRVALSFSGSSTSYSNKRYVPKRVKVIAKHVNQSVAANENLSICGYFISEHQCKNITTDSNGEIRFLIPSDFHSRIQVKSLNYPKLERNWNDVMQESSYNLYIYEDWKTFYDPNNASLTIIKDEKLPCETGKNISLIVPVLHVSKPQADADIHVQVSSRGQIVSNEKIKVNLSDGKLPVRNDVNLMPLDEVPEGLVRGSFNIKLNLPPTVSPQIKILVWYFTADGIVADENDIEIHDCLAHKVDLAWSSAKVQPGEEANIIVKGSENALCSIGVVDKSVELLSKQSNELKIRDILSIRSGYEIRSWDGDSLNVNYCRKKYNYTELSAEERNSTDRYWEAGRAYVDSFTKLYRSGFYVSSNLGIDKRICDILFIEDLESKQHRRPPSAPIPFAGNVEVNFAPQDQIQADKKTQVVAMHHSVSDVDRVTTVVEEIEGGEVEERNYLPETWLWLLKPLSSTGELVEPHSLPHTITEWVGKAVCVHPSDGVGVSEVSSIVTFTPFFTELTLPSSVTRGEVLPVKISVFNYLDEAVPVKLAVLESEEYAFVQGESGVRELCIAPNTKGFETVKVNLTKIGDVNITVEAVTQPLSSGSCGSESPPAKKDRLKRSLPVEPEGYLREKTVTKYICSEDIENSNGGVLDSLKLEPPSDIVKESERAWISAIGDLMGPTIENLGYLVRLPSGCGEQNMINFAPNIYIMDYLETTGQNTEVLKKKLTKFLNHGYQRQLTFQHPNSSFSAFGTNDGAGSTWLTAFVVKSFAQAKPYTQIDEESLKKSAEWLKQLQNKQGCFESRGRVIHKELQGGLGSGGKSDALLTAYVLTALIEEGNLTSDIIDSAVQCITSDTSDHPYSLALKAYSLSLAQKSEIAKPIINQLLTSAVSNSSVLRWNLPDRKGEDTSLHVETAAYAILALVKHDPVAYSDELRKIVRWLSGRRNGQGGFVSTQDTVVSLQALSAFEEVYPSEQLALSIIAASPSDELKFDINEENKFLLQLQDVQTLPTAFDLKVSGTGCGLVQSVLRYNVESDTESDAFTLKVEAIPSSSDECNSYDISACAKYNLADGASNMAIIEVKLVSGFIPVKKDLKALVANTNTTFKRYEVDGRKVVLYLDEITGEQSCANFGVYQDVQIESAKPGSVTVYDYYQPEYEATKKFELQTKDCNVN